MNSIEKYRSLGSTTVEYALIIAIVIAMTIGAAQTMRPNLTHFFESAVTQVGAFLGGSDDGRNGSPDRAGNDDSTNGIVNNRANTDSGSGWATVWNGVKQVGGVFKGAGEGVWDMGVGIYTLAKDVNAMTNPIAIITNPEKARETANKYMQVGVAIWNQPGDVAYALVEPIHTDWKNGNYGEAIGRGGIEVISMIFAPTKLGKVGKAGDVAADVASAANKIDDISGVANTVNKLDELADAATISKTTGSGASNINAQAALRAKLSGLEKAQQSAARTRQLSDGRVRYYTKEVPARTQGLTRGASFVTEYNPKTGQIRQWMESYTHSGQVNRVHPKSINGQTLNSQHYPPTARELGL